MVQFLNVLYSELCLKSRRLDYRGHTNLKRLVSPSLDKLHVTKLEISDVSVYRRVQSPDLYDKFSLFIIHYFSRHEYLSHPGVLNSF